MAIQVTPSQSASVGRAERASGDRGLGGPERRKTRPISTRSLCAGGLATRAASHGAPNTGIDHVGYELDVAVAKQGVNPFRMATSSSDVVGKPVPPIVGANAVGQAAATIAVRIVGWPHVVVHRMCGGRVKPAAPSRVLKR